ncbi:MAG: dephospho-CoA kinase [Gammaproteobacteria bacterium]|nr:dephospho-CoA kinase [Gammaproteobacteria bacterium]MBT4493742.1 dephospho-CoA kinase [Gammaproteobacteria bacterium]MBT7371539.1 dephospho-CoA kinase [Gammaproteobacteria bacterium]
MKIICLTGGLASGKSTAVRYLEDKGAHIIDADILGHRAYEPGTGAHRSVIEAFGEDVRSPGDQIDRKALGGKVFGKPDQLKKLTDIVWPEIRRLAEKEIEKVQTTQPNKIVVLEAAVLFEAGWEDIGDEVWVISVDRETAIRRSMERDSAPREAVESRLDSQLSNEERANKADLIIYNDKAEAALFSQLDTAWEAIQ